MRGTSWNAANSRAINWRISVGVKAGSQPDDSGVSVDINVTRHIRAQGEVDRNGGGAVAVGMEWEYWKRSSAALHHPAGEHLEFAVAT